MFWYYTNIAIFTTSFFEKIMEIYFITTSYSGEIYFIITSYMSQMLYAGQSDREDVTFFSDF